MSNNPKQTTDQLVTFIRKTVKRAGFSQMVVGVSGGVDSAVALALAVRALGGKKVHAGIFPYGNFNREGEKDAGEMVKRLNIKSANVHKVDIQPLSDPFFSLDPKTEELRRGNMMARIRMLLLFDLAKKLNALVLGTENKTEHLLGYFTRFGDEASDLEPLRGLYKTQVRQLAKYLGVPEKIITKAPTAGLWEGQTDEGEFGFTYEAADQILHLYLDKKLRAEEIEREGFAKELIGKVIGRVEKNKFKHYLPYVIGKS